MSSYSPAETAEKSGFSIDTLRYYEKIGLLARIARDASGRRVFSDDDLAWLGMLRCLRETGMPIAEMLRYSELVRGGEATLRERIELLQEHDRRVEDQIARLRSQQGQIKWKIDLYRGRAGTGAGAVAGARVSAART
ncbi:MerR family transcriptional regulator [Spirillospora sp. NPDC029432]|uniref:MerR family transcriptional regulator n=1 Tax=Spirillospora sp. NPDC029432 TaxID=3154599 RepID=UPI0034563AFF